MRTKEEMAFEMVKAMVRLESERSVNQAAYKEMLDRERLEMLKYMRQQENAK